MDFLGQLHPHGVFLRREAVGLGIDDKALYGAVRAGELVRVRHGAFVQAERWRTSRAEDRHALKAHAIALSHQPPFAISHVSGALLHGLRTWNANLDRVHVSRVAETGGRRDRDVTYHLRSELELAEVAGSPVLPVAQCALEAACLVGVEEGVVILDSVYDSGGCSMDDLRSAYLARIGWPGTARLRITLPLAQPGSQSVGESRLRYLFWSQGLPRPVLQFPVFESGEVIAYCDFAWPDHGVLGEFDGKVKYEEHLRVGERPSDAVFREKVREDRIRELTGWSVIRFTWADLSNPDQTRARLARALRRAA